MRSRVLGGVLVGTSLAMATDGPFWLGVVVALLGIVGVNLVIDSALREHEHEAVPPLRRSR